MESENAREVLLNTVLPVTSDGRVDERRDIFRRGDGCIVILFGQNGQLLLAHHDSGGFRVPWMCVEEMKTDWFGTESTDIKLCVLVQTILDTPWVSEITEIYYKPYWECLDDASKGTLVWSVPCY